MNRNKRLFCMLLVCLIAGAATLAEEPAPEITAAPTAVVTQAPADEPAPKPAVEPAAESVSEPAAEPPADPVTEPAAEPTAKPAAEHATEPTAEPAVSPSTESTAEPASEPTSEPTAEPTTESTAEPTTEPEPSAETTAEPTADPTSDPAAEPTAAPTDAPTAAPTAEPTAEPATEPTAAPTAVPIEQIVVTVAGNAQQVENVWQIAVQNPEEEIVFQWDSVETATSYEVRIADSQNAEVHAAETAETTLSLPASTFGTDMYVMIISAYSAAAADEAERMLIKQGVMQFVLVQNQGENPGDFPGGFPEGGFPGGGFPGGFGGGRPGGSFGGGSMPDGAMPEEQGFRVTPGEALTSSHTSGSKDMQLYGTVDAKAQEGSMTILSLDDVQLDITLDDQNSSFFAVCEEDTLILTPESKGDVWSVSAFALKTLNRSGISRIRLVFGEETLELSTQWNPQGSEYAHLCTEGYVSKDYTLTVTPGETLVTVADAVYIINENNELVGG